MSGSILIIILSRYIDRENYCHVTNKCFSVNQDAHNVNEQTIYIFYNNKKKKKIKKITVLWYTIDSHNNFFIGMDRTIQKRNK